MKRNHIIQFVIFIMLVIILTMPLVSYISYLDEVGYGNNLTFESMHFYQIYPMLILSGFIVWIHLNPEKKQRKWQYLLTFIVYVLLMIYLLHTKEYNDPKEMVNTVRFSMKARRIYLMLIPSLVTIFLSGLYEYTHHSQKSLRITWLVLFMAMLVYQISSIIEANTWAVGKDVDYKIFFGDYAMWIFMLFNILLVTITNYIDLRENKTLHHISFVLVNAFIGICLVVQMSELTLSPKSMQLEFVVCFLPTIIALVCNIIKTYLTKTKLGVSQ